jgi:hypothetical protein
LKGFILFSIEGYGSIINCKILCGRKEYKIGKDLLEAIFDFAVSKDITFWVLHSLLSEKLVNYYQSFGFKRGTSNYQKGVVKVLEMEMVIPERQILADNECLISFPTADPSDFLYIDEFENAEYEDNES